MTKAKVNKIQSNGEFDPKVSVKGEESGRIWQLAFLEELVWKHPRSIQFVQKNKAEISALREPTINLLTCLTSA